MDIEELHKVSKAKIFCPYYAMKERITGADIIFMPYNYLVDEKIRENFDLDFENSIMIFDEAHNITSTCEEQSSFLIDSKMLETALTELEELKTVKRQNEERELKSKDQDIDHVKLMTTNFHRYLLNYDIYSTSEKFHIQNSFLSKKSCVLPGS